jgi:hypothetical protein
VSNRPTLSARLEPAGEPLGADAYFTSRSRRVLPGTRKPETVSLAIETAPGLEALRAQTSSRKQGPKWDEVNQRASYYLPVDLLQELDRVAGPALSKSQIVTAALRQYLSGASRQRA